jgi:hypothetical protein
VLGFEQRDADLFGYARAIDDLTSGRACEFRPGGRFDLYQ